MKTKKNNYDYFDNDYIIKIEDSLQELLKAKAYDDFKKLDIKLPSVPNGSSEAAKELKSSIFEVANEIKELCSYDENINVLVVYVFTE